MARCLAFLVLLLSACHEIGYLDLPPVPTATQSAIIVVEHGGGAERAATVRSGAVLGVPVIGGQMKAPLAAADGSQVTLLFYNRTLKELLLQEGRIEVVGLTTPSRRLPPADQTFTTTVSDGGQEGWQETNVTPDLRLEALTEGCAELAGCYLTAPDQRDRLCTIPCPTPAAPDPPDPPEPPEPPVFAPCPLGWTAASHHSYCTPPSREICPSDQIQFLSDARCAPWDCASGTWPDDLPPTNVRYVQSGAVGGDGSITLPFGTINEALNNSVFDMTVALSGSFSEDLTLEGQMRVVGLCPSRTIIAGDLVATSSVTLRGFHVAGAIRVAGASAQIENVSIDPGGSVGIEVDNADVLLSQVAISNASTGVDLLNGSTAMITQTIVANNLGIAVHVAGSRALLEQVLLADSASGLSVEESGHAEVRWSASMGNRLAGVVAKLSGTVELSDVVIEGGQGCEAPGGGIDAFSAAGVKVTRAYIAGQTCRGIRLRHHTTATITDTIIQNIGPADRPTKAVELASRVARLERVLILDAFDYGVEARNEMGVIELVDVSIERIRAGDETHEVRGIFGDLDRLWLERVLIDDTDLTGLELKETTEVRGTDLTIRNLAEGKDTGVGIKIFAEADLELSRVAIENASNRGIEQFNSRRVHLSDLTISSVNKIAMELKIIDRFSAEVFVDRASVQNCGTGFDLGISAELSNLAIAGMEGGFGTTADGIFVRQGRASLNRFTITDCAAAGLVVDTAASLALEDGRVYDNEIGARVAQKVDLDELLLRVQFHDNTIDFDRDFEGR